MKLPFNLIENQSESNTCEIIFGNSVSENIFDTNLNKDDITKLLSQFKNIKKMNLKFFEKKHYQYTHNDLQLHLQNKNEHIVYRRTLHNKEVYNRNEKNYDMLFLLLSNSL